MKAAIRLCLVALVAVAAVPWPGSAQETASTNGVTAEVRSEVLDRYQVAIVRNGVVLTPRRGTSETIEVTDQGVAIEGVPLSGSEVADDDASRAP